MGDRSWGYSRSYGGSSGGGTIKPRYSSSSSYNTGSNSYTRSDERDRSRDRMESSYTRSSSNTVHQHRNDYDASSRGSSSSGTVGESYSRFGRDSDSRYYGSRHAATTSSKTSKVQDDDEPIITWEKPARPKDRSRSPTAYMNRSPPRPSSTDSRSRERSPNSIRITVSNRAVNSSSRLDRREPSEDPLKPAKYGVGMEIVKLMERLKEYIPWLTARKATIFEQHRDRELKDEVDDIDWCLDVIEDIKADENVGMITIKRAQEMVMRLITKGPVTAPPSDDEVQIVETVLRDDIYSARSPSPPVFIDGPQFSRRNEFPDTNPRVIPTDRNEMTMTGSVPGIPGRSYIINPLAVRADKFPYSQQSPLSNPPTASGKPERLYQHLQTQKQHESFLPNRHSQDQNPPHSGNAINRKESEALNTRHEYPSRIERQPESSEMIYEYGHGQPDPHKSDESLFERRKLPTNIAEMSQRDPNLNHRDDGSNRSNKKALEDEDMRRRMREWEDDSDEDEILIIRKGKKTQDQDMRVYVAESRSKGIRSGEEIRSPEPEDINEFNRFEFGRDITNPASLQSKPQLPVNIPVQPQVPLALQQNPAPIPQQNQSQPSNSVPLQHQLINMNPQMFNPFLNPAMAGMPAGMAASFLQSQAQMLMGYSPQQNPGGGLLPLPIPRNIPPGFRFPTPPVPGHPVTIPSKDMILSRLNQPNAQTNEEIMLSRIKARAAESFSRKSIQDSNPGSSQSSSQILDPRLKPRQPREFLRDPRRNENEDDPRFRKNDYQNERGRRDDGHEGNRIGDDRWNKDRHSSVGDRDRDDRSYREDCDKKNDSGNEDEGSGRVKRIFINPPADKFSGEGRGRRNSGDDERLDRYRRYSGEDDSQHEGRVSRSFSRDSSYPNSSKSSEAENKTDRHIQGREIETFPRVTQFPSLSARIQAVRDKLNRTAIENQENSTQNRLEEIRREAEVLHTLGPNSKGKTDSNLETALTSSLENSPVTAKPNKGKRARVSSNSSDDTNNPKIPRKTLKGKNKGESSGVTLRRSPRIKPALPEKEDSSPNAKPKNSLKRSPAISTTSSEGESPVGNTFRIPRLKKPITPVEDSLDDSDDELKLTIDDSQPFITDENPFPEDEGNDETFRRSPPKQKVALVEADDRSSPSRKSQPEASIDSSKSCLPAGTDELLKSLLFSSLSSEEADVLRSSEDYLASTLARLKEELSAKVKDKARQVHNSGDNAESSVSSTTPTDKLHSTSDSKDNDDKAEDSTSRGRSLIRKRPQAKRRSSLEKLHDALREMNFDSMMPLGPRRAQTKLAQEEHLHAEQQKNAEATSAPKLSPVVVLENVAAGKPSNSNMVGNSASETQGAKKGVIKKRKVVMKKGQNFDEEVDDDLSLVDSAESENVSPPNKKQKTIRGGVVIGPNDLIVNEALSKIKMESDYVPIKSEIEDEEPKADSLGVDLRDIDVKDLHLKPGDFGFDNNMLDFDDYELSDDFNFRTCADDFVIKEVELGNLEVADSKPLLFTECSKKLKTSDNLTASASGSEIKRRGRKKKAESGPTCQLCSFSGKKVVVHYVNKHPGVTIPSSAITETAFKTLQERNQSESPQLMEIRFRPTDTIRCIFCNLIVSSIPIYCRHLTSHTGEFRFTCSICNIRFSNKSAAAAHCKIHKKDNIEVSEILVEAKVPMEDGENEFYAYLCRECNYFQIHSENIRSHLDFTKHSDMDVACIKFKGPDLPEEDLKITVRPPVDEKPQPLLESNKPVFFPPTDVPLPQAPKFQPTDVRRFTCGKKSRLDTFLERFPKDFPKECSNEDSDSVDEPLESEDAILEASKQTLTWMVDTVCCPGEIEAEMSALVSALEQTEENLRSPQSDYAESDSESGSYTEEEYEYESEFSDEYEPNDYYLKPSDDEVDAPEDRKEDEVEKNDNEGSPLIKIRSLLDSSLTSPQEPLSPVSPHPTTPLFISSPWSLSPTYDIEGQENINKVENLEGSELYRCANIGCYNQFEEPNSFKVHITRCVLGATPGVRKIACCHCEKNFKNAKSLMDHIDVHGRHLLGCGICSYRGRIPQDMNRHFKVSHKIVGCKGNTINTSQYLTSLWFPKDVFAKRVEPKQIEEYTLLYIPRPQFQPDEIADIPKQCILASEIHCALCKYSTKVRVNMIRHLKLHKEAEENGTTLVPVEAPVNPVPWLERKELMFDKMTNWAGSSHTPKEIVVANEALPRFVEDQFRYVCSVTGCEQITVDDSLLRAHMKCLHSEVDYYACPHCQKHELTRKNPSFTVPIEKIGFHLKLHGPKLLKCGHCGYINTQTKVMEKHVAEKHIEKKPIHYVIRAIGDEGSAGTSRRGSVDESGKSLEKWKCGSCKFNSSTWEDARDHCAEAHGMKAQFMCDSCTFNTNSIFQLMSHMGDKSCAKSELEPPRIIVNFSRGDIGEDKARYLYWRRPNAKEHLRGIFFLHENDAGAAVPGTSKPMTSRGTPTLFKHSPKYSSKESPQKEKVNIISIL